MIIVTSSRKVINFDNIVQICIKESRETKFITITKDTPELEVEYSNKFHELQSQGYILSDNDNTSVSKMVKTVSILQCVGIEDTYTITLKEDSIEECVDAMERIINDYKKGEKVCLV